MVAKAPPDARSAAVEDGTPQAPQGRSESPEVPAPNQVPKAVSALDRLRKNVLESCSYLLLVSDAVDEIDEMQRWLEGRE